MKINIKNFRNVVDAEVKINEGKINYFLGSNEAGKTNVLTVLRLLDKKSRLIINDEDYVKKNGRKISDHPSIFVDDESGRVNEITKNNTVSFMLPNNDAKTEYLKRIENSKEEHQNIKNKINEEISTKSEIGDADSEVIIAELRDVLSILQSVFDNKKVVDESWKKLINNKFSSDLSKSLKESYKNMTIDFPYVNYIEPIIKAKQEEEVFYPVSELFNSDSVIRNIFEAFTSAESISLIQELQDIENLIEREGAENEIFDELNKNIAEYFEKFKHIMAVPYFKISGGKIILLIQSKKKWEYDSKNENERSLGFKTFSRIIIELKSIKESSTEKSFYIVDEPEQSLHPLLQSELISEMKELSGGHLTILLATHSPYILKVEKIEDVLDCQYISRDISGQVIIETFGDLKEVLLKAEEYFSSSNEMEHFYFYKIVFDSYGNHNIYSMINRKIKDIQRKINSGKTVNENRKKIEDLILLKNFINEKD